MSRKFQVIVHDLESFDEACYPGRYKTGEQCLLNMHISIRIKNQKKKSLFKWIRKNTLIESP